MRTLYWECAMGAAGDMLMGSLYELYIEKQKFLDVMNCLLPGVTLAAEAVTRQGISGTHMRVQIHGHEEGCGHHDHHDHHHHHRSPADIDAMIDGFPLPEAVRTNAKRVYRSIAQAEALAHGCAPGEVHFHEVGSLDAVMDVTGVCYLMELLAPEAVLASPVAVGSGTVSTAHGLLPVPAPATARLLEGIPVTAGEIAAELCTPTGAALLKRFAGSFGPMPAGTVLGCGYGCGTKDFARANCVRAFLLETAAEAAGPNDAVTELKANLDDMTGEALGFAMERLLEAGEILAHTSTFGVRRTDCSRYALTVEKETVETAFGPISCKTGSGYGVTKRKPEYEDAAAAAREGGAALETVREAARMGERRADNAAGKKTADLN